MVSCVRYRKYYNSTFYYIFFFLFLFFHRGSFLTSFVLGPWAGNAKLFNVNKFYYCYSCVSFVFAHPPLAPLPFTPSLLLPLATRMGIVASSVHCACIYNILLYFILSSTHHKFPQGFMFSTAPRSASPLGALVCLVVCRLIRHCHNLLHSHFRNGFIELARRTRGLSMPFPLCL